MAISRIFEQEYYFLCSEGVILEVVAADDHKSC